MLTRMEIGRIAGIPIYLDMFFVLVLLIFTYPYFTAGSTQAMSAGFVIPQCWTRLRSWGCRLSSCTCWASPGACRIILFTMMWWMIL